MTLLLSHNVLKAIAILPCKDEEKSIKEVILGLRKSKLDLEIVGIDDASIDSTNSILQKYADKTITRNEVKLELS